KSVGSIRQVESTLDDPRKEIARDAEETAALLQLVRIDRRIDPEELVDQLGTSEKARTTDAGRLCARHETFTIEVLELCAVHLVPKVVAGLNRSGQSLIRDRRDRAGRGSRALVRRPP